MKTMLLTAAALTALLPATANAAGNALNGLTALSQTNLIVLGDMTGGHDVEGTTFVGGSISGNVSNFGIGRSNQGEVASSRPTLTVGGDLGGANLGNGSNGGVGSIATRKSVDIGDSFTGGNFSVDGALIRAGNSLSGFNINSGTNAYYGVDMSGFQNTYPVKDATLAPGGANDLHAAIAAQTATLTADLGALSTALYGLTIANNPSSYAAVDQNTDKFIARDSGTGFAVIDVTAAQLAAATNFVYDIATVHGGGYLPTIINVTGLTATSSLTLNANSNNSAYNPYVLWNFGDVAQVTLNRQFNGGLLAPDALVSNATPIEGSVAVGTFHQGGEVHLGTFKGDPALVTALTPAGPVGGVPEPAAWGLMVAGFGLIGVARRRRPQVVAA